MKQHTEALLLLASKIVTENSRLSTIVFHLSGCSTSSVMQRHLYAAYPHDRHLFAYDNVINVVGRGRNISNWAAYLRRGCAPVVPMSRLRGLTDSLSTIGSEFSAGIVESWIAVIDAMLSLKEETEPQRHCEPAYLLSKEERRKRKEERQRRMRLPIYLPFVFRLGFLREDDGGVAALCMTNLVQFITGGRTRTFTKEDSNAALRALEAWKKEDVDEFGDSRYAKYVSAGLKESIESAIFCHNKIHLADKIILDTVQPAKDWTLKAVQKATTCPCCVEDGDDDDEDSSEDEGTEEAGEGGGGPSKKSSMTHNLLPNGWTDGKAGFAFDPAAAMAQAGRL